MQQAPERPSFGLSKARDRCAGPALLLDAAAAAVLDANDAGWRVLGLDGQTVHPPVALDCAMPAVQSLRRWRGGPQVLLLWTQRGSVSHRCEVSVEDGGALLVRVADRQDEPTRLRRGTPHPPPSRDRSAHVAACETPDGALRAKLAHELKTPLAAVAAYAEILKDEHFGPLGSDRYRDCARSIHEGARHALSVVESMLKDGVETADAPQLTFADVDPGSIVRSCLAVARPLAERAGVLLSCEAPQCLPRVVADAVSLRQMLLNLLTNAIKFARPGDRVSISLAHDGDGPLRISVADTGPGMDTAQVGPGSSARRHARIRPANAGMGLGLPLTRSLAEANGAVLAIDSAVGRGTCATLTFGKNRLVL